MVLSHSIICMEREAFMGDRGNPNHQQYPKRGNVRSDMSRLRDPNKYPCIDSGQ